MHAARYRWTILLVGVTTAMTLGCRGSKPFGRFGQVTNEPQSEQFDVDSPRQRLASVKPRSETEVTVTIQDDNSPRTDRFVDDPGAPPMRTVSKTSVSKTSVSDTIVDQPRTASTKQRLTTELGDKLTLPTSSSIDALANSNLSERPKSAVKQTSATENVTKPKNQKQPSPSVATEHSELMAAFSDYPPEVQREALRRLVAATASSAEQTSQPASLASALHRNLDNLPELPAASDVRPDETTVRLASAEQRDRRRTDTQQRIETKRAISDSRSAVASLTDEPVQVERSVASNSVTDLDVNDLEPVTIQTISDIDDDQTAIQTVSAARTSDSGSMVSRAVGDLDSTIPSKSELSKATVIGNTDTSDTAADDTQSLYASLLKQMAKAPAGESESARASRMIKMRHLLVLSGNLDAAVEQIEGMSEPEQEFLRHQLLGLWTMVDPDGHPVPSRRITTALPQLREATKFAAAATDSLEVRSLAFCTEIESYGQIKTFSGNRFDSGQQVILYCEIENFSANKNADGYETNLQGSYDIYNTKNEKVISQLLPADKQVSANYLRDYFIAYQMHLPAQLGKGTYRLQLTMEDVNGKKYGQSSIPFEIAK
ncbi:hypothetical protein [Rubripirellula reticaptiva]|uniref:Uncharacterized protein n=1 Tax=Rubripirellula reticaptiva TaxID=2528013 RepID=A0A5C6FB72_9BACT|nr:hypothetical protein [Rubripirellula reticaptiva]TWU57564.1 hypothetical protein Poly59_04710 [Rubripirellula reticaptiva]